MTRTVCGVCGWDRCRCETHPGYVIGAHWLETAYSRVCAGEDEAEVLRDYGWARGNGVLRRKNERLRKALRTETARCAQINEDAAQRYRDAGWDSEATALRDAARQMQAGAEK